MAIIFYNSKNCFIFRKKKRFLIFIYSIYVNKQKTVTSYFSEAKLKAKLKTEKFFLIYFYSMAIESIHISTFVMSIVID